MEENKKLKLFISYSHLDNLNENPYIEEFKKHITPLKTNGLIEDWYDREIVHGEEFQIEIDDNLEDAEIICLFISANFLSSEACMNEKIKALELRKKKWISVVPIILSSCGWKDDKDICKLLVPRDGTPVLNNFQFRNDAWFDIYNALKKIIEKEIKINQLKITEEFKNFLRDIEMLTAAHFQKEKVFLDDIFVYPELDKFDSLREFEERINSEKLFKNLLDYPKIVISGKEQSGKTTMSKMLFKELRNKNFLPVYIHDKKNLFKRKKLENIISHSFSQQYEGISINEVDNKRIVPIIDDFHLAKNKEKHIKDLSEYANSIIFVDDIFDINIQDTNLIRSFTHFKIKEFNPTLRNELIKKWISLTDKGNMDIDYKIIDKITDLINNILGRTIGSGIMPSYPFFILSVIDTYDTFERPIEQEITSQGYCYQSLIYFYLRKKGVKNDDFDTYINFLTELAFYIYKEKKYELSQDDFTTFMNLYSEKYYLQIEPDILLENLDPIVSSDSFSNYSFHHQYFYFFFVARYLADGSEDEEVKKEIGNIMKNLHINENAYIAVFIAHHSRNTKILDEIKDIASSLFNKYKPATLTIDEVMFFDDQEDIILEAVLPPADVTAEKGRKERLIREDKLEESEKDREQKNNDNNDILEIELRSAIKTVEVMGCIIKNRSGSLEKKKLEDTFKEAMNLYLRILSNFFELIKNEDGQKAMIDLISERLRKITDESEGELIQPSEEELKRLAGIIFWNLSFLLVCGVINKIVQSLGYDKLTKIVNKVCDEIDTPASFMVKLGISMWYEKNIQFKELEKKIKQKDFSKIARKTINLMIVNHCSLHQMSYADRQRIVNTLKISAKKLLTESYGESE
jgi:hypothetical protein